MRDANGQALSCVYYENEAGTALSGEAAHARRGAADCGEFCEVARAIAEILNWHSFEKTDAA